MRNPLIGVMLVLALRLAAPALCQRQVLTITPIPRPEAWVMPNLLSSVDPQYPQEAIKQGIGGKVVLKIVIDQMGNVISAGPSEGDPLLQEASLQSVKQWKFRPYVLNSEHIAVETTVTIAFTPDPPTVVAPQPFRGKRMIRVAEGVMDGSLLHRVDALYPEAAKAKHVHGSVSLKVEIDREGNVTVLKTETGKPELVEAAINAAKQWKYKPMIIEGEPIFVETTIKVRFQN